MYDRIQVVQKVIDAVGARTFLEIGVWKAEAFMAIRAPRKIGVDPIKPAPAILQAGAKAIEDSLNAAGGSDRIAVDISTGRGGASLAVNVESTARSLASTSSSSASALAGESTIKYLQKTSDEFFADLPGIVLKDGIDVAFVDGLHEWSQVVTDVNNCLRYLNEGGVIVMHDCRPTAEIQTVRPEGLEAAKRSPEWHGSWTGDVWKSIACLRSSRDDLNIFVLDCDWGMGIVTRGKPEGLLSYSRPDINRLSYQDLVRDRGRILNLKNPAYLDSFLGSLQMREQDTSEPACV